jgi:hypothetical protein
VWGYIDGNNADEWTWDDDYNEEAIVSGTDQPWCLFLDSRGDSHWPWCKAVHCAYASCA